MTKRILVPLDQSPLAGHASSSPPRRSTGRRSRTCAPLIGAGARATGTPGTRDYRALMERAGARFEIGPTDPEDMALLHFTSGTPRCPRRAAGRSCAGS
jgi:acyl-coenzyme A synthetase/AMP-(fatty) acid ligase